MSHPLMAGALALALLSSCAWTAPADDAGDESWVRMAIPALLGRKPHNLDEVRVLTRMADEVGRAAVADALLARPELVDYWSQVLMDDQQVDRSGAAKVNQACYDTPLLPPGLGPKLLAHLRAADATAPFCLQPPQRTSERSGEGGESKAEETTTRSSTGEEKLAGQTTDGAAETADEGALTPEQLAELDFLPTAEWFAQSSHNVSMAMETDGAAPPVEAVPIASTEDVDLCPPFNMADVIRAGVQYDDLFAVYRAALVPAATFTSTDAFEAASIIKERAGARWFETYTQRDTMCTRCHTTSYSTTDARPKNHHWDRFAEPDADLEGTAFGWWNPPQGKMFYGGDGNPVVRSLANNFFRPDQHGRIINTGNMFSPWGLDATCTTNSQAGFHGYRHTLPYGSMHVAGAGGLPQSDQYNVLTLANVYRDALDTFGSATLTLPNWELTPTTGNDTIQAAAMWAGCTASCHSTINDPDAELEPGEPPDLGPIISRMSNGRLFGVIRNGSASGAMLSQSTDAAKIHRLIRYIRNNLRGNDIGQIPYDPRPLFEDGSHALLVLLAQSIVDDLVAEVQGRGLVIEHGFARNEVTLGLQAHLTSVLLQRWSLRDVLREIVLSEAFNRRAPVDGGLAYVLPAVSNPWSAVSSTVTAPADGSHHNSVGDDVHRYSVVNLLESLHRALGWPAPNLGMFPTGDWLAPWPRGDLQHDMGRYRSAGERDGAQVDFANLLAWEASIDRCTKPDKVRTTDVELVPMLNGQLVGQTSPGFVNRTGWVDWIDHLAAESNGDHSLEATILALKERLLTQATLTPTEKTKLATFFGVPLGTTFSTVDHAPKLRELCGVFVKTPQFMLGGLAPETGLPASPEPHVCLANEPCTEGEICRTYAATLRVLGTEYICPPSGPLGEPDPPAGN